MVDQPTQSQTTVRDAAMRTAKANYVTEDYVSTNPRMVELVRKLRARVHHNHVAADKWAVIPDPLCQDAADAIERLTEKIVELEQLHD